MEIIAVLGDGKHLLLSSVWSLTAFQMHCSSTAAAFAEVGNQLLPPSPLPTVPTTHVYLSISPIFSLFPLSLFCCHHIKTLVGLFVSVDLGSRKHWKKRCGEQIPEGRRHRIVTEV